MFWVQIKTIVCVCDFATSTRDPQAQEILDEIHKPGSWWTVLMSRVLVYLMISSWRSSYVSWRGQDGLWNTDQALAGNSTALAYDDRRSRAALTSRRSGCCCCCREQRLMKLVMFYFGENIPVQSIARIFSFGYHTWTSCTPFTANSLKYRVRPVAYSTPHQLHDSRIDLLSLWNTHISSHLPKTTDMTNKTSSRLTL